jgi:hypothetical protein
MMKRFMPVAAVLLLCVGGCTTTVQQASAGFHKPAGDYQLVVMKPDVVVSVLTAGGQLEAREDWSLAAREHVLESLKEQQAKHGGSTQVVFASTDAQSDDPELAELTRLHAAVGGSIQLHKYTPGQALPTKNGKFDWTLGELATNFGARSGYDYALFLHATDSFSSGGRVALQAVSMLGCVVGVCVMPAGGSQEAFVSLVDLKTGNVVWFNHLLTGVGDIRTRQGADAMVKKLLESMRDAKTVKTTRTKKSTKSKKARKEV